MAAEEKKSTEPAESAENPLAPCPRALLLELEGVAVNPRPALFELLQENLPNADPKVDEGLFIRHALHASPAEVAASLAEPLGLKATARNALAEKLRKGLDAFYASDTAALGDGLKPVLEAAVEEGMPVALLSGQGEEAAQALLERLGLDGWGARAFCFEPDGDFPGADLWLKIAKTLGATARGCTALVSSQTACRAALAAGMRCVVVPDVFTAGQDFGGADLVVDSLKDEKAADVLATH